MARIRTIKPEFPQSESMGRVSRDARLCFILLWTLADDQGRLRGNSRMLASLLFPYDDDAKKHIDTWLKELSAEGCIVQYEVDGTTYIQVLNWLAHQKIDKPSASKIPPHTEASRSLSNPLEESSEDQGSRIKDQGGEGTTSAEPPSDSAQIVPVIAIPLIDKTEFLVDQNMVDEWQETYPAVDVMQQLREMRQWCIANPTKRKTSRGVLAFITRWLGSRQDRGGGSPGYQPVNKQAAVEQRNRAVADSWLAKQEAFDEAL